VRGRHDEHALRNAMRANTMPQPIGPLPLPAGIGEPKPAPAPLVKPVSPDMASLAAGL